MWCMMHCKQLHGTNTAELVVDACDREMIGPVHNQMPFSHTYPSTLTLLEIDVRVCTVQQHTTYLSQSFQIHTESPTSFRASSQRGLPYLNQQILRIVCIIQRITLRTLIFAVRKPFWHRNCFTKLCSMLATTLKYICTES